LSNHQILIFQKSPSTVLG